VGRLWLGSWNLPVFDKYKGAGAVALALIRNFSSGFKMQFNFDSSALDSSSKRIFSKNFLKSVINKKGAGAAIRNIGSSSWRQGFGSALI
jgi:hypothetical protein